jgi:hypothetical protein
LKWGNTQRYKISIDERLAIDLCGEKFPSKGRLSRSIWPSYDNNIFPFHATMWMFVQLIKTVLL